MKVVEKKLDDGTIELKCTASTSDVSQAFNSMQLQFAKQMGIRPMGNKPLSECADEQMGIKDLDKVVEPQVIEALVPMALDKRDLIPAFLPTSKPTSPLKRGRTFSFTLNVTPKPEYELTSYEPVKISVHPMPDYEDQIDQEISNMAASYTEYVDDEPHTIGKDDNLKIAMTCTLNGEELKNLCTDGRSYSTGQGLMPDGFDENIVGMEVGETKTFSFEGPDIDDDGNEVTNTYEATVTVLSTQKRVAPVINDEWVNKNMPWYGSYQGLRDAISASVEKQQKPQYDNYVRSVAAGELAKRFKGRIDDPVYEAMAKTMSQNLHQQAAAQNMTWDQFVQQNGGEQQLNMMMMLQTRELLTQGYALDAVFRHEGLVITDDDILDVCWQLNPNDPKHVRRQLEESGNGWSLRESAERMRANKWVVEHADITVYEEAPTESEPAPAKDEAPADDVETPADAE